MKLIPTILLATAFLAPWPIPPAQAGALDVPIIWNARFSTFKGDLSCRYGDPHCNRCVYNVEEQFRTIARDGKDNGTVKVWEWENREKTGDASVDEILDVWFGGGQHFQGIARAPSPSANLFATWGGAPSGLFLIDGGEKSNGRTEESGKIEVVHHGKTDHPGGIQGIGEHFVVAEYEGGKAYLTFMDASRPTVDGISAPISDSEAASVAGTRLAGGGYLFATNITSKLKEYSFWYTPSLDSPHMEKVYAEKITASQPDLGISNTGFEGISFVNECGTGDIYMIGANAKAINGLGDGTWALFKVTHPGIPALDYRMRNSDEMHSPACNARAGGSAFAGKRGELGIYCTQKPQSDSQLIYSLVCAATAGPVAYNFVASITGGAILPPLPGLEAIATFFGVPSCTKAFIDENQAAYTEFWPGTATPETPAGEVTETVRLDVATHGHPDPYSSEPWATTTVVVAIDEAPSAAGGERIASCVAGSTSKTCSFNLKKGSRVRLLATGNGDGTDWTDATCAARQVKSSADSTRCDLTMQSNFSVTARSYVVL
jgi:hypothetical protein